MTLRLYDSVFSQVLIDFLFVVSFNVVFVTA